MTNEHVLRNVSFEKKQKGLNYYLSRPPRLPFSTAQRNNCRRVLTTVTQRGWRKRACGPAVRTDPRGTPEGAKKVS